MQDVAADVGVSEFQAVYLNAELDISTFCIGRGRYLNLSVIALKYLTEAELRAVIAHECAHHHNKAMLLNRTYNRANILFSSFANSLISAVSTFNKVFNGNILLSQTLGAGAFALLPLIPCLYLYRYFLTFTGFLVKDAEYEFYCDSVAAKYIGGNIFASALQKLVDLHVSNGRFLRRKSIKDDEHSNYSTAEQVYLKGLDREFINVRSFNTKDRVEAINSKTDTHPPPASRIKRAQLIGCKLDFSEPLLSEIEIYSLLKALPDPPFLTIYKQNEQKLKALSQAQQSIGEATIVFNRKPSWAEGLIKNYKIFIDGEFVGDIKKRSSQCFNVNPGLHMVYIQARKWKSEELELILSGGQQVEIDCGQLPDGNFYMKQREN